ncbi:MAG: Holliday junction branch migration protein RuvA [Syntrophobacteraceae bacterium]
MIGYLEGKLRHKSPDQIIVDVHGVGYSVLVPLSTFYDLPDPGHTVSLNIHTHVREDTLQLYGFRTMSEKEMFLHLVTVNGVGPRLAVSILSRMNPEELRRALMEQDHQRLRGIPGVGKKIADRIMLELYEKVKPKGEKETEPALTPAEINIYSDALSALLNLGYRPAEAEKALRRAQEKLGENPPLELFLKEALRLVA